MYTTTFEFESKEDAAVLVELISDTLLEWNQQENKVFIYEKFEEDAKHNESYFEYILACDKEIYVEVLVEDNTEKSNINYYEEYGLKESNFY